jgi:hypothetical protein
LFIHLISYKILIEKKFYLFPRVIFDGWDIHRLDDYLCKSVGKESNRKNKRVFIANKNIQDYEGNDMSLNNYNEPEEKILIALMRLKIKSFIII